MSRRWSDRAAAASPALGVATAVALVVTLLGALSIGTAQAQVAAGAPVAAAASSPLSSMMQGLFGLVAVLALIVAAGWAMKKIGPRTRPHGAVQVVGGASVGPREKVVVVRFEGQTLLLGVAPGQVSLLRSSATTSPDPELDAPAPAGGPASFVERLRTARGRA